MDVLTPADDPLTALVGARVLVACAAGGGAFVGTLARATRDVVALDPAAGAYYGLTPWSPGAPHASDRLYPLPGPALLARRHVLYVLAWPAP